eukprot:jgi/Tetstr1/420642/TSEL_011730.t1
MAALFMALDDLLPYVPSVNQDFTPYFALSRNHAEAIDKAFRFRLPLLRRLNEIKRLHGLVGVLAQQQKRAGGIIKHNYTNAVKNMAATQAVPGDNVDEGSSPEPPAK